MRRTNITTEVAIRTTFSRVSMHTGCAARPRRVAASRVVEVGLGDEVDRAREKLLETVLQREAGGGVLRGRQRIEFNQEVEVARFGVELASGRGAEEVESANADLAAQFGHLRAISFKHFRHLPTSGP